MFTYDAPVDAGSYIAEYELSTENHGVVNGRIILQVYVP